MALAPISNRRIFEAPENITMAPKWGFIIYRCDYQSDDAWNAFINGWTTLVKKDLLTSYKDGDRLLQTLEFTVRDNKYYLESASIEKVRTLHTTWAKSDESVTEQMRITKTRTYNYPARYSYCIHVDSASLNSCLKYFAALRSEKRDMSYLNKRGCALKEEAYVNLISTPYPRPMNQDEAEEEAIEEGWDLTDDTPVSIKANLPCILPEMYGEVDDTYDRWAQAISHDPNGVLQP
jgi:hypothetical protein